MLGRFITVLSHSFPSSLYRHFSVLETGTQSHSIAVFSRGKAGSANKGLQAEDKRWLLHHTDFSEADLDRLYNIFKTDYPRGGMFRSQVNKYFQQLLELLQFLGNI